VTLRTPEVMNRFSFSENKGKKESIDKKGEEGINR
jgi:hypothetical protein